MEEKKNTLFPDEEEDEEEVDEEVTLIDSLGSVEKKKKKKNASPRSSLMKQSIGDRPREKKTCRFLDNCDMEKRIEMNTKGHDRRSTLDEENEDEDEDEDAVAAVGKILIFKPRGQSKSARRKKCFIRLVLCTFAIGLSFAIVSILMKGTFKLNIKSFHSFLGSTIDFSHSTSVDMSCELNSSLVWRQSLPFIINPVIHVIHPPTYRPVQWKERSSQKKVLQPGQLVAIAFETGTDSPIYQSETCDIYFPSNHKLRQTRVSQSDGDLIQQNRFPWTFGCGGGVAAFDPIDGSLVWSILVKHAVKSINCNLDVNNDGFNDCFVTGSNALIMAIDGNTGQIIWSIKHQDLVVHPLSTNFAPLVTSYDMDKDGKSDLLVLNSGISQDYKEKIPAHLIFISSVTGQVLKHIQYWIGTPENTFVLNEKSMSPVQMLDSDGSTTILLPGGVRNSLFAVSLQSLIEGKFSTESFVINDDGTTDSFISFEPIITTCNLDSNYDVIVPFSNGSVVCFSGKDFSVIWKNNGLPGEEVKVAPAVAKKSISDLVLLVTRGKEILANDIEYLVDIKNGKTLSRIPMVHFDDQHADVSAGGAVHFVPGSPVAVSARTSSDSFLLWSTFANSSSCSRTHEKRMNCSSFGLLSLPLEANGNLKIKPLYDSLDWWNLEREASQKGFSESELVAKWKTRSANDQSALFDPGMPYEMYNVDGDMGNSDGSMAFDQEKRRRKKRKKRQSKRSKSIEKNERGFSTAALIAKDNPSDGSDVIFATWWQPMKTLETMSLPMDSLIEVCIRKYSDPQTAQKMKQSMKEILLHTDYLQMVKKYCQEKIAATQRHTFSRGSTWQDDLFGHKLGQFNLYRFNLTCLGSHSRVAPISDQIWPQSHGWAGSNTVRAPLYH